MKLVSEFDQALLANAHPPDWKNPDPAPRYNLVVLGGGTAGLVTAIGAAGLGARVALVERNLLGGDCLNYGCVPSKTLLRSARASVDVRDAGELGIEVAAARPSFIAVMERVKRIRAELAPTDSAARLTSVGVDVFLGDARFNGRDSVVVDGRTLRFKKAVIATGSRAKEPPIPGLADAGYLTNETVFSLTELPGRLAVIGGGPLGCELAQAFARLGSEVTLLHSHAHVLDREDEDAAARVAAALSRDGVQIVTSCVVVGVTAGSSGKSLALDLGGGEGRELLVDEILVGVGRTPSVEGLGLDAAGVVYDRSGVEVDDRLRTSNRRIYAAGDVCSRFKFTHVADALARIAIQNALFLGRRKASALSIPWCTYTDPELAHCGISEKEARARGIATRVFVQELRDVDRARIDGEADGFVKVIVRDGSDEILGGTIVARHASDMISELTLAVVGRLGLKTLARTIHPYPSQAEAIRKVADAYERSRLTPFLARLARKWLAWTR
jgi:pyruvate/2-oxoglutarate dehydrogenase complex dihydrolipoamide dehydrogenase (E3) component